MTIISKQSRHLADTYLDAKRSESPALSASSSSSVYDEDAEEGEEESRLEGLVEQYAQVFRALHASTIQRALEPFDAELEALDEKARSGSSLPTQARRMTLWAKRTALVNEQSGRGERYRALIAQARALRKEIDREAAERGPYIKLELAQLERSPYLKKLSNSGRLLRARKRSLEKEQEDLSGLPSRLEDIETRSTQAAPLLPQQSLRSRRSERSMRDEQQREEHEIGRKRERERKERMSGRMGRRVWGVYYG
ncbi:hypothetical protein JCM8547_005322 [Rhodosporidiobolus lusitaniae]